MKRGVSYLVSGLACLASVGCAGRDASVGFGDYRMSRLTYDKFIEDVTRGSDYMKSGPRYDDIISFCNYYDENEDDYLSYWEMRKGLEKSR